MPVRFLVALLLAASVACVPGFANDEADVRIEFQRMTSGGLAVEGRIKVDMTISSGQGTCLLGIPFPIANDAPFSIEPGSLDSAVLSGRVPPENAYYMILVRRNPQEEMHLTFGFAQCAFLLAPSVVAPEYGAITLAFADAARQASLLIPEATSVPIGEVTVSAPSLDLRMATSGQTPSLVTSGARTIEGTYIQTGSVVVYLGDQQAKAGERLKFWVIAAMFGLPLGFSAAALVKRRLWAGIAAPMSAAVGALAWFLIGPGFGLDERTAGSLLIAPTMVLLRSLWVLVTSGSRGTPRHREEQ